MARTGRRPGATTTRDAILRAARLRFAEAGYEQTSIRAVAADAGVNPTLVMHFFGSKEELFRAAVEWPFEPAMLESALLGAGGAGLGEGPGPRFPGLRGGPAAPPPPPGGGGPGAPPAAPGGAALGDDERGLGPAAARVPGRPRLPQSGRRARGRRPRA